MVPRPFDIEYAPELIDFSLLIDGLAAGGCSHRHKSLRHRSPLSSLDAKIHSCNVPHRWLPLQGVKVLRLGSLPFTEDQERLSRSAGRASPFERPASGLVPLVGQHASLGPSPTLHPRFTWPPPAP